LTLIPRYLLEQVKEIDEKTIDAIYTYASDIMTYPVVNEEGIVVGRIAKTSVWVAVLQDVAHIIKGFIWADLDPIERKVFIQGCSVDKEYQSNNGEVLRYMIDYIRSLRIPEEWKNNIQMTTTQPKAFEKAGCKRSRRILMELKNEQGEQLDNGVVGETPRED
jgi:hypothetical protein